MWLVMLPSSDSILLHRIVWINHVTRLGQQEVCTRDSVPIQQKLQETLHDSACPPALFLCRKETVSQIGAAPS